MMKRARITAVAIIATGLAGAPFVFAQSQPDQTPPMNQEDMQDMMRGGDMMGMMNMMSQMGEMMGACTKMMQAMTPDDETPEEGEKPGSPG